jgi:hypothetical protein
VYLDRLPVGSIRISIGHEAHADRTGALETIGPILTGAAGQFVFTDLATGAYEVAAKRDGWIGGAAGQPDWKTRGRMIVLRDGQSLSGVRAPMWRRPLISGRVIDERDRPVAGALVVAFQPFSIGGRLWTNGPMGYADWTDDRGAFLIGATPGESFLVARPEGHRALSQRGRRQLYESVLYSQALSLGNAVLLRLDPGEERAGLELQLRPVPGFSITGQVVGHRSGRVDLELTPDPTSRFEETTRESSHNGRIALDGVPAGRYRLHVSQTTDATPEATANRLAPQPTLWADVPVTITDRDVEVSVVLREGVPISGRVEFDGTATKPTVQTLNRGSMVVARGDGNDSYWLNGAFLPEERFTTDRIPPGRYLFEIKPPDGWKVKSIVAASRDVTDASFDVGSAPIQDVTITFTERLSRLTGRVIFPSVDAPKRAWVMIFTTDRDRWVDYGRRPRAIQLLLTGAATDYSAELPAGSYYAVATDEEIGEVRTPEVFSALARSASWVHLGDRETKTQDLRVQRVRQ